MKINTLDKVKKLTFEIKFNDWDNIECKYTIDYYHRPDGYFLDIPSCDLHIPMCKPSLINNNFDILLTSVFYFPSKVSHSVAEYIFKNF